MSGPQSVLGITYGHWLLAFLTKAFLMPRVNQFFLIQMVRGKIIIFVLHFSVQVSVEQSPSCSTETGDDTAHFQATTQGLSVPRLMR